MSFVFVWVSCVCVLSHVWLFVTPWTIAPQAPLFMGFSRQEYWSGLPFCSPGDLLDQGSIPGLPHCRRVFYHLSHLGSPGTGRLAWLVKSGSTLPPGVAVGLDLPGILCFPASPRTLGPGSPGDCPPMRQETSHWLSQQVPCRSRPH